MGPSAVDPGLGFGTAWLRHGITQLLAPICWRFIPTVAVPQMIALLHPQLYVFRRVADLCAPLEPHLLNPSPLLVGSE
eukprot:8769589-Pyramimonas_sp.AAC.1